MCMSHRKSTFMMFVVLLWISKGNAAYIRQSQDVAEESQHAVCNISTKDVQTSANASVTRQLKGVCSSKQLDLHFEQLEAKLMKELQSIKKMLDQKIYEPYSAGYLPEYSDDIDSTKVIVGDEHIDETLPIFKTIQTARNQNGTKGNEGSIFILNQNKSMSDELSISDKLSTFSFENNRQNPTKSTTNIDRIIYLNDTMHLSGKSKVYYYFWKVENFHELIKKSDRYKTSPSFLVLGHELAIQLFPNQPQKDYLTIRLRTSRSFVKKHKFSILQRASTGRNINSIILGMNSIETDRFSVTLRTIKNFECLKEDSIIVELNIYL